MCAFNGASQDLPVDAHFASLIDWSRPWMQPWRALGEPLGEAARRSGHLPQALNEAGQSPVRFIPQAELPAGVAYESHIYATGGVPTREGLHDFFNALCWMRFPATKRLLNLWQARAIETAGGVGAQRGPLRDALTLFDENVALLQAPSPVWEALRQRHWKALFCELRKQWQSSQLVLFGHALTEKLVQPYKSITAHVLCMPVPLDLPSDNGIGIHPWDAWLTEHLNPQVLASKPFTPLPVLGVPGWWSDNETPEFYDDATVFRPARHSTVR